MIQKKEYTAFSIDTSIFERQGCRIESGLFNSLSQFKDSSVQIIVTDLVHQELLKHLSINIKTALDRLHTGLNKGISHLIDIKDDLAIIKASLNDLDKIDIMAENRAKRYYESIGAKMINSSEYLNVSGLLEKYFKAKHPFTESGDKKAEFPDAIALMTLEEWAKKNNRKVIVVSADNGWRDFCKGHDRLLWMSNLKDVITFFQPEGHVADFKRFIKAIGIDSFTFFLEKELIKALVHNIDDSDIDIEANSYHEYEYDDVEASYLSHEYSRFSLDDIATDVISISSDKVVFQLYVNVACNVSAEFSFNIYDSIDKDYVHLGSNHYNVDTEYERSVIIELSGPYSDNDLTKMSLISIDVPGRRIYVDFGEIDIDYGDDYLLDSD